MITYIIRRLIYILLTLFAVVTITFFMIHSIPGDPLLTIVQDMPLSTREMYLSRYGFDQPLYIQYIKFLAQLFHGDLGSSIRYSGRSVVSIITQFSPASLTIGVIALIIGAGGGIALGTFSALHQGRMLDKVLSVFALIGTTLPVFVTGLLLQYLLTVKLRVFPTTGWHGIRYMILPIVALSVDPLATYTRYMRSSMLDVMNQDYVLVAEAKGLSQEQLIRKHMLKNALIPLIALLCGSVAAIFSGSFIIERLFSIPGIGRYFISAITDRDYSVVLGLNVFFTAVYLIALFVSDLLLALLDPRVGFDKER